jgi:TPR repeat protein
VIVNHEPEPIQPKRAEEHAIVEEMPEVPSDLDDPSVADAVAAYQAHALGNDAVAQLKLGIAYYRGRSAPADAKLACFWIMRSMFAGSQQAAQYLKYCVQRVPPADQGKLQSTIFMWAPGQPVPQL